MLDKKAIDTLSGQGFKFHPLSDEWVLLTSSDPYDNNNLDFGHIPCMNNNKRSKAFWFAMAFYQDPHCGICRAELPDSYKMLMELKRL